MPTAARYVAGYNYGEEARREILKIRKVYSYSFFVIPYSDIYIFLPSLFLVLRGL